MGRMSDQWIDSMNENNATWKCPSCKHQNVTDYEPPAIDMTSDSAADMQASDHDVFICENCDEQYEAVIYNSIGGIEVSMTDHNGDDIPVDVAFTNYDEEEWEPSDSPSDEFYVAMEGLNALMELQSPSRYDDQLLNRLIFTNIITSLETYLKDTLLNLIEDDTSIQVNFFKSETDMKEQNVLMSNILTDPLLPLKILKNHFKPLSFHNFPKVNNFYKIAIGKGIFLDEAHTALLCKAKAQRHDCVHSNGKDKDGVKLHDFTKDYLIVVAEAAQRLVNRMDSILANRSF